ncbi:cation-translocating P-type ATPase, partial [Clostridium botulinum]
MNESKIDLYKGLTTREAQKRIKKYGPNVLKKKKKVSPFKIFLEQFNDFIIWVLIVATAISGFMGEKADAITILIIVIMNAILGFVQEFKTEKSLEALNELSSPTAKVIRDSSVKVINAEELVIGDLVILESGDRIPADCILVEDSSFMADESLLTGESVGVEKNSSSKNNNVYMGTVVLKGRAKAKVVEIGMGTEMGKIAEMLDDIQVEKSPLKEKLASLGKVLVVLCIIICVIVTLTGIWRGQDKYEMFLLGVSLAVAAIPEGLPAIVTVALALGVSRMLKRNALVRKLPAVETLGCTSIICSDKTGTLTENNMTVKKMYYDNKIYNLDNRNFPENLILKKIFTYCNDFNLDMKEKDINKSVLGDPTETALVKAFFRGKNEIKSFTDKGRRIYDNPFDSDRKMMSVIVQDGSGETCYVKGAPERVIKKCKYILISGEAQKLTDKHRHDVEKAIEKMSYEALRCIAGAYKREGLTRSTTLENDLIFVGVAGIIDPPRREVKDAVLKCKMAGIKPIMITGDHKNTAYAIGKELDICKNEKEVLEGEEIDKLSDNDLNKKLDTITVFARVNPNHKLRIVKEFKNKNKIVAMTGDGVNDAPAVKEADIGISMGITGTDVTKEASSMILLDDNFATIVASVEEGRVIYDNIRKFIR